MVRPPRRVQDLQSRISRAQDELEASTEQVAGFSPFGTDHVGLRDQVAPEQLREGGRIVSVAAIIAVAANTDGRREIIGLGIGPSEAETFWSTFLKSLNATDETPGLPRYATWWSPCDEVINPDSSVPLAGEVVVSKRGAALRATCGSTLV